MRVKETVEHLCLCPDKDITILLTDCADYLNTWLDRDGRTHLDIAYWVPKYIKFRDTRAFANMGMLYRKFYPCRTYDIL